MQIRNPVIPGFYPDPSVCRRGKDYFLVTSSFGYFPGVPLFHSRDLVHYRQIGHCLTRRSQLPLDRASNPGGGIYAPTIRFHDDAFYMTSTNLSSDGHFIVRTDDPFGRWSDPVWVDQDGIDPSLLFDDDGTVYFTSTGVEEGRRGIIQSSIDIATGKRLCEPRLVWCGTGGQFPEAPHLFRLGGVYYLMIAEGGTEYGHMVTIARSESPWGPFETCPGNPILSHRSTDLPIQATGHADMVQGPDGRWWMVCLGIRTHGYPRVHHLGRETFLAPVSWDDDGWPHAGSEGTVEMDYEVDGLESHPWPEEPTIDDFSGPELRSCWNFLKNPDPRIWSLTDRPGRLRLSCSPATLDGRDAPAFIGRRQQHFTCRVSCLLELDAAAPSDEAGLTVFLNRWHHYEIGVRGEPANRRIFVRRRIGGLSAVTAEASAPAGPIVLRIEATSGEYGFFWLGEGDAAAGPGSSADAGEKSSKPLATGESRYLSSEVGGGFTGVYFGMYASSCGGECRGSAWFSWFRYEPGSEETPQ